MPRNKGAQPSVKRREVRVITHPQKFEIRKNVDGSRSISGYAATFGDLSLDLGGFREKIQRGAFGQSLKDNPDVLCLYGHDSNQILGRVSSGTLQIAEDAKGLRFTCKLPDTSTARDLIALMERNDVSQMSFGFSTIRDEWQEVDGQLIRTLIEVQLYEVSVVGQPAYITSEVNLRSCPVPLRRKLTKRDDIADGDADFDDPDTDIDCDDDPDDPACQDEDRDLCACNCRACAEGRCERCSDIRCADLRCMRDGCFIQSDEDGRNHNHQVAVLQLRLKLAQHRARPVISN